MHSQRLSQVAYEIQTIHNFGARSNVLLEVTQKHFKLTDRQVLQVVQGLLRPAVDILASKGIQYDELRNVLDLAVTATNADRPGATPTK